MSTALVPLAEIPAMTLCSVCPDPGRCCRKFNFLTSTDEGKSYHERTYWKDEIAADIRAMREYGFPFELLEIKNTYQDEETGRDYVTAWFHCPKVTPDGRCSIYLDRPKLCRTFIPGNGGQLCAFPLIKPEDIVIPDHEHAG